jgi:hypothetical protein
MERQRDYRIEDFGFDIVKVALFGLLGCSAVLAAAPRLPVQSGPPASLSGYVLENTTGKPINGAEVKVLRPSSDVTVKSGPDGRFHFENLPVDAYNISVSKEGYVSATGGRFGGRRMSLAAGEKRTDFILRMQGTGTVSGRILDSNGRPLPQASVNVFRFTYQDLQAEPSGMRVVSGRNTDDRGEFRVFNVPSGVYLVLVSPPASSSTSGAALYPGEREIGRAQSIVVRAEEETRLRDLTLPLPMRGAVRLRVVNATGGSLPQGIATRIAAVPFGWDVTNSSSTTGLIRYGSPSTSPVESREMWPSLVGPYVFYTAMQTAVGNVAGYVKADYSGAGMDVDFVVARLEGQIKGRVLLESANGSTQPLAGAEIEFHMASAESNFSNKDGMFNINGVLNGPYRFTGAFEMPKGYYVAAIRERERDVLTEGLMVSSGTPEIEVRVRADGGTLGGKVADVRDRVVVDAVVALVPQSLLQVRTDRHNTFRIEHSDGSGNFELRDIIPGEYLIYAWSDLEEGAVMDPWFMERYKGKGLPVRVEPGGRLTVDLRILDE